MENSLGKKIAGLREDIRAVPNLQGQVHILRRDTALLQVGHAMT